MKKETQRLFDKMKRVIDLSSNKHSRVVERYITLANRKINAEVDKCRNEWGVVGASQGINNRYVSKFGKFSERDRAVVDRCL